MRIPKVRGVRLFAQGRTGSKYKKPELLILKPTVLSTQDNGKSGHSHVSQSLSWEKTEVKGFISRQKEEGSCAYRRGGPSLAGKAPCNTSPINHQLRVHSGPGTAHRVPIGSSGPSWGLPGLTMAGWEWQKRIRTREILGEARGAASKGSPS